MSYKPLFHGLSFVVVISGRRMSLLLRLGPQTGFLYVCVYIHVWGTIIIITTSAVSVVDLNLC